MADDDRGTYTWDKAVHEIALSTPLTLNEAFDYCWPLRELAVHPYDVVPLLIGLATESTIIRGRGMFLARLMRLGPGIDPARVRAYRVTTDRASDGHAVRADLYAPEDVEILMLPEERPHG